jgi:hypothetical protein
MTRQYIPWWALVPAVAEVIALMWLVFPVIGLGA